MRRMHGTRKLPALLASLALLTAGCGGEGAAGEQGAINLGVIIEETGPLASLGLPELDAIKLAVKQLNKDGGINGRTVNLVVRDSESQPAVASAAAREFVTRGDIPAVLGTATGAGCGAVNAILAPEGVMQFCLSPIATKFNPLIFWSQGALDDYHVFLGPWFDHERIRTVALVRTADTTGDAMEKVVNGVIARKPGLKLVGVETFNSGATNVQTQLTKLRDLNPDVVIAGTSGSNLLPIAQAMNALAMRQPLMVGQGSVVHSVLELVKDSIVPGGMVSGLYWVNVPVDEVPEDVPYRDKIIAFRDLWKAEYNKPTGHSEAAAFDATNQIAEALKSGANTGAEIAAKIESTDYTGVLGDYTYSKTDHQGLTYTKGMLKFGEDGQFHFLYMAK